MAFGKKRTNLIKSVAELRDADYSKDAELGRIYNRLIKNRKQFEDVLEKDMKAVMQISSLDLTLEHHTDKMVELSHQVADASEVIFDNSAETTNVAEKVASQHEELTSTIVEAADETKIVSEKIEAGQRELTGIRNLSDRTIEVSEEMQKDMDELFEVIKRMNEVIAGINAISSQTNLLALNASIEAARAGEAGKGFAVVADEIRGLAEETQKLTGDMGAFVEGIRNASEKSAKSATSTVESLGSMTEKIGTVWKINEENLKNVSQVSESVSALAAVSEEISSSMNELEIQAGNIKGQCERLKDNSADMREVSNQLKAVTKPVVGIEKELDDAAKLMGKMTDDAFFRLEKMEFAKYIKNAVVAHKAWLDTLKNMTAQHMVMPLQIDSTKCGFGHFYYAITPKTPEIRDMWSALGEKHKKFHGYGSSVIKALFAEDYTKAEQIANEAEMYSKELIKDLEKILKIVEE